MNFIAIDTSGAHLAIAAQKCKKNIVYFEDNSLQKHSVKLMPKLEDVLLELDMQPFEADYLGVVVGPGSFTGIRIGIATIKALAFALNKKVLCVTAFDLLAYNIKNKKVAAVIDAMHGNFYLQEFLDGNKFGDAKFVEFSKLKALENDGYIIVATNDIQGILTKVVELKSNYLLFQNVVNLVCPSQIKALYIRKSQAEESR